MIFLEIIFRIVHLSQLQNLFRGQYNTLVKHQKFDWDHQSFAHIEERKQMLQEIGIFL